MPDHVANLLLRIRGETDDAERDVDQLIARLEAFGASDASADVDVETAGATAHLTELIALLNTVDGRDVTVDVNVDRDGAAKHAVSDIAQGIMGLAGEVKNLAGSVGGVGDVLAGLGSGAANAGDSATQAGKGFTLFGASLPMLIAIGIPVVVMLTAMVAAVGALVASLTFAVAGLSALAIAGFGALLPAIGLVIAGIERFKRTSGIAGTAAHALRESFRGIVPELQKAFGPGVAQVFRGLASAIETIKPAIGALQGPFNSLGKAIRQALIYAGPQLRELVNQFGALAEAATPLVGPIVDIFLQLGKIFANIALAAMPLLVDGARSVAGWLENIANKTGPMSGLGDTIRGLVDHLKSWWNLLKAIAGVFLAFFQAAAPQGKGLVDSLAKGAEHLANWLRSKEGMDAVHNFFSETLPLVLEIVKGIGRILVLLLQITQILAPAMTTLGVAFNAISGALSAVLGLLGPVLSLVFKFGNMPNLIISAWVGLIGHFGAVWDAIKTGFSAVIDFLQQGWNRTKAAASSVWNAMKSAASSAWGAIKSVVSSGANAVAGFVASGLNRSKAAASNVWNAIKGGASSAWNAIKSVVSSAIGTLVSNASARLSALRGAASAVWNAIKSAASSAWNAVSNAVKTGIDKAVGFVTGMISRFYQAGRAAVEALARGIIAGGVAAYNAAKSVVSKVTGLLPGSEPKDTSSPMRGLADRGAAIARNMARGIKAAGPEMILALDDALQEMEWRIKAWTDRAENWPKRIKGIARSVRNSLEHMVPTLEGLKGFSEAVMDLGDTLQDLARTARDAFIEIRKSTQLANIDNSAEGQELKRLMGEGVGADLGLATTQNAEKIGDLKDQLTALNAEAANPGRTRSLAAIQSDIVNTQRAIRDAEAAQAKLSRDARIAELTEIINDRKANAEEQARIAKEGRDAEANAYEASLLKQFTALQTSLAKGKLSYADFVKAVNKILGPLGIQFETSNQTEMALRGGKRFIDAFADGMKHASARAKAVLKEILKDLRNMLPGSEPRDRSSPLYGLKATGQAALENISDGMPIAGRKLLASMYKELAPVANMAATIAVRATPAVAAAPGYSGPAEIHRHFHLPPGPGGGFQPMYAASQLDGLLEDEGGVPG